MWKKVSIENESCKLELQFHPIWFKSVVYKTTLADRLIAKFKDMRKTDFDVTIVESFLFFAFKVCSARLDYNAACIELRSSHLIISSWMFLHILLCNCRWLFTMRQQLLLLSIVFLIVRATNLLQFQCTFFLCFVDP